MERLQERTRFPVVGWDNPADLVTPACCFHGRRRQQAGTFADLSQMKASLAFASRRSSISNGSARLKCFHGRPRHQSRKEPIDHQRKMSSNTGFEGLTPNTMSGRVMGCRTINKAEHGLTDSGSGGKTVGWLSF